MKKKPKKELNTNPFGEGYRACVDDHKEEKDNPYPAGTENYDQWRSGWYNARHEGQQN